MFERLGILWVQFKDVQKGTALVLCPELLRNLPQRLHGVTSCDLSLSLEKFHSMLNQLINMKQDHNSSTEARFSSFANAP